MQISHTFGWVVTILLAVYGVGFITTNYAVVILWFTRRRQGSLVPLMGGLALGLAMLLCPLVAFRPWAWIPLVADLGCVYLFGGWVYHQLFKKRDDKHVV